MAAADKVNAAEAPELRELLVDALADLLDGYSGDELAEAMWQAALGVIDRALARTRDWAWWKTYPRDEHARLTGELEEALRLAGFAAEFQAARNLAVADESRLVRDLAEQAAAARRRAQTLPAERARLARAAERAARASASGPS